MRRGDLLRELEEAYRRYDERLPEWVRESRRRARAIFRELEEGGWPVGRFGADFDLLRFRPDIAPERPTRRGFGELPEGMRRQAELAGQRLDERYRAGSKLQEDATTTYLGFTPACLEGVLCRHPDGLVVKDIEEAVFEYPWLERFWSKILPMNLDKYTAYNVGYSRGGIFVWVRKGVQVDLPLQACFFVETQGYAQLPRIIVIAEPHSKLHLISGCVTAPACEEGLHGCITEIYVGRGAEVTYTMIHNFTHGFHVRPRIGAIVEEGATYIENLIVIGPCSSDQAYPTAILRGQGARAVIRTIVLGLGASDIDMGSCLILAAPGTRGELVSRAMVMESSAVRMRGTLKAYAEQVRGHLECRGLLLSPTARAWAYPQLRSSCQGADLTHEAAIGRIAEEELCYLMSRGMTEGEATSMIARGFLEVEAPDLPTPLRQEVNRVVSASLEKVL